MARFSCSFGKFANGISTIPRKSSRVNRFSSNTCNTSLCSVAFTLNTNSSFQTGFSVCYTARTKKKTFLMNENYESEITTWIWTLTFFFVLVSTESILMSPLIVFKSILTYGSLCVDRIVAHKLKSFAFCRYKWKNEKREIVIEELNLELIQVLFPNDKCSTYLAPKISFFANDCPDIILIRSWLVPSSLCSWNEKSKDGIWLDIRVT